MRILVTGASGFIGRRLVACLLAGGDEPYAVCRRQDHGLACRAVVAEDPLDAGFHEALIAAEGIEVVVNLLAAGVVPSERGADRLVAANSVFPSSLAAAAARAGARAFIQIGSSAEYAMTGELQAIDEGSPLERQRLYGATKAAGSLLAQSVACSMDLPTVVLRLFNVFGPGEKAYRLFPAIAHALAEGRPVPLSAGDQIRDFLQVDDVCAAIREVAHRLAGAGAELSGEYNLASGEAVSVRDFALEVAAAMEADAALLRFGEVPKRPDDLPYVVASTHRLDAVIGTAKSRSLNAAIAESLYEMQLKGTNAN